MTQQPGGPVEAGSRISELDIIRGFALFGVLWMNLFEHVGLAIPDDKVIELAPKAVETIVGFASIWLMIGKAQALFSILFGFGFALFLERAEKAGANGTRLYLRRATFLLIFGVAHGMLLWAGDILNSYALMGFFLVLTRRWPGWALLSLGLVLTVLGTVILNIAYAHLYPGQTPSWVLAGDAGTLRRFPVFMSSDYGAYLVELYRSWIELYGTPIGPVYLGWIFGRFLVGQWLFRQGWVQNAAAYAPQFRKWAAILLAAGLAMALLGPTLKLCGIKLAEPWKYLAQIDGRGSQVVLALGYAAGFMVLCQHGHWRRRLSGLAAAGQMALTNYVTQSFLFFFLLYGFGFALLPYVGPTFCLVVAIIFYAMQIAFSRWWLARYRFGPIEWVWRSFTYGTRQPMRKSAPGGAPATA
ncbi:MAG: DUF418 domain-containing protein [Sphingobium sp.]